jgi:hypothetical protein
MPSRLVCLEICAEITCHHGHRDNEEEVEDRLSHLGAGVEVDYEDNKDPEGDLEGL